MKSTVVAILIALISFSANAGMYKCNINGTISYQEAECPKGKGGAVQVTTSAELRATGSERSLNSQSKDSFDKYMTAGDYTRAAAFATTPEQKQRVAQAQANKKNKCANMEIRRDQLYANSKWKGGRMEHAAEAQEARLEYHCN